MGVLAHVLTAIPMGCADTLVDIPARIHDLELSSMEERCAAIWKFSGLEAEQNL